MADIQELNVSSPFAPDLITDTLRDESGHLGRPAELVAIRIPIYVKRIGTLLAFKLDSPNETRSPGRGLLDQFTELPRAPEKLDLNEVIDQRLEMGILELAKKWGPLGLCQQGAPLHSKPSSHCQGIFAVPGVPGGSHSSGLQFKRPVEVIPVQPGPDICGPATPPDGFDFAEPIAAWQIYSLLALSVLKLIPDMTDALHAAVKRSVRREGGLLVTEQGISPPTVVMDLWARFQIVQNLLDWWVRAGRLRPRLVLDLPNPRVTTSGASLLGAIAIQLLNVVDEESQTFKCYGCKTRYIPDRTPRSRDRNYCLTCRDNGTADRIRYREWKAENPGRKRTAKCRQVNS